MPKDPFLILGVSSDATQAEIDSAYNTLRDKYRLDMHLEGERGRDAARKLTELEDAYRRACEISARGAVGGDVYSQVEQYLRENRFEEAQTLLDNISERNAEWHYLQSALFYKKGWLSESRSQLRMACSMDPANDKYRRALERLEGRDSGRTTSGPTSSAGPDYRSAGSTSHGYHRSYSDYESSRRADDTACAFCQGLICANLCCDCCR
ncbi:MAG: hypothetical protein IKC60_05100 [Clostridia bacterium]|nr:hypothetical protein [Clostridia bacterium]